MDFDGFKTLIDALGDGEKNTAAEVRFILNNLIQNIYLPGDIKMVLCTDQELIDDYTATGLGIGKRAGWAQLNGLNGTIPFGGRMPMGFSDVYNQLGFRGGSADAVVVEHTHKFTGSNRDNGDPGNLIVTAPDEGNGLKSSLSIEGESGVGKNIPPFVVVLYLVKLP